jgi:hypothetical protein
MHFVTCDLNETRDSETRSMKPELSEQGKHITPIGNTLNLPSSYRRWPVSLFHEDIY